MNVILGGIFTAMCVWALVVTLGPALVDLLSWLLRLVGAY